MKKFSKLLLVVMAIGVFFSTVDTYAASKYYKYVWTNHYDAQYMEYYDDIITNDIIEVKEGYLTVGYDQSEGGGVNGTIPCIRLLDHSGKLIKEVKMDEYSNGKLKRIYQVGDKYYVFGYVSGHVALMMVLDSAYNVILEEHFDDFDLEFDESYETYVEYYNGYFYIFSPTDLTYGKMFKVSTHLYDGQAVYYSELTTAEKQYLNGYVNIRQYAEDYYTEDYGYYAYPAFVADLSDGWLYGYRLEAYNYSTKEETYSFHMTKVDNKGNEKWNVEIEDEDFFVRDAIEFNGVIVLNGTDEYGNPSLITYDTNGNRLEKDFLSNYYSAEDNKAFWGEHLILLSNGFALTGTNMLALEKPEGEPGNDGPVIMNEETTNPPTSVSEPLEFDAKVLYFTIGYEVFTITDGNGTVTPSATSAFADDVITFVVTPNEGYKVGYVNVTDEHGNTVTFPGNTFTMPHADVTIEAAFLIDNPKTGNTTIGATAIGLLLASIPLLQSMKKKDKFYTV